jgi:hypothetical protein
VTPRLARSSRKPTVGLRAATDCSRMNSRLRSSSKSRGSTASSTASTLGRAPLSSRTRSPEEATVMGSTITPWAEPALRNCSPISRFLAGEKTRPTRAALSDVFTYSNTRSRFG